MIDAFWDFLNHNGPALQTVALVVGLVFVVLQTWQVGKQLRLGNITATSLHFKELNQFLLEHPDILTALNVTSQDIAADLIIGTFEARYMMHRARMIKKSMWEADKRTMMDAFSNKFIRDEWHRIEHEYDSKFGNFINREILPGVKTAAPSTS
jgi:hypothetical protein